MGVKRGLRGFEAEDDRSLLTCFLTSDELAILFDGIRRHRIKQTRLRLNTLRHKKTIRNHWPIGPVERLPILWRKVKKTVRKQIDVRQQELPLF